MPAPAQAPTHTHASGASDSDGARRRGDAGYERTPGHEPELTAGERRESQVNGERRRSAVTHAYTAAGRVVQEPPEERPGISVLA